MNNIRFSPVSQKATSHWWQLKSFRPFASESSNVDNNSAGSNSNQVAVAVPLVHQKVTCIFFFLILFLLIVYFHFKKKRQYYL